VLDRGKALGHEPIVMIGKCTRAIGPYRGKLGRQPFSSTVFFIVSSIKKV
jgi:hypothetical protein